MSHPMSLRTLSSLTLAAALTLSVSGFALAQPQSDTGAKQDMKSAGHETAHATKDAGHGISKGTKKAYHSTKTGTKKAYHKTGHGVKKLGDKMDPNKPSN